MPSYIAPTINTCCFSNNLFLYQRFGRKNILFLTMAVQTVFSFLQIFSFCGALFACWGWPPFQDTSVWSVRIWSVKSVRCRSSELNSRDLWRTLCLVVVSLWWSLSVLALCLCSEPGCCVTWKNWHLFSLKKWPRIYGGSNWKLCRKLQLSALQPSVRSGLQAVLMNAQINTKTDCGQIAHCSRAFHEVSLFTGDRWKLLPRLEERLV